MKNTTVKPSPISGKGLFADENVVKGEEILPVKGKVVEWHIVSKETALAYPNWVGIGPNKWIDTEGEVVFLNHSCNPNVGLINKSDHELMVVALRDIPAGAELLLDYSTTEGNTLWEMNCNCGASNCRHKISSVQTIPKEQYETYLPYVPLFFQGIYEESKVS